MIEMLNNIPNHFYIKIKNKNVLNLENIILIDNLVHNFLDDNFLMEFY